MDNRQNISPVSGKKAAGRLRASRLMTFSSPRFERSFERRVENTMNSPRVGRALPLVLLFSLLLALVGGTAHATFVPGAFNATPWTQGTTMSTSGMPPNFKRYSAQANVDQGFKLLRFNNNWNDGYGDGYWISQWNHVWDLPHVTSGYDDLFIKAPFVNGRTVSIVTRTDNTNETEKFGFMMTSGTPRTISSVSGGTTTVSTGTTVNIDITLSGTKLSEEFVLVRYHTGGGFSSSGSFVTAATNVSGNVWRATIPAQASPCTVTWYAMTSTVESPSNANADFLTLTVLNNSGSNYSYTVANVPTVTTPTATSIAATSATLGGTVTANGGAALTSRGTVYGTSAAPTGNSLAEGGTSVAAFSHSRTGLTANTLYTYRAYAVNGAGTGYSADATFTTLPAAPTVGAGSSATTSGFTANWTAPTMGSAAFSYTVEVDNDINFVSIDATVSSISSASTSQAITGLAAGTTYYYRVRAVNATGAGANSSTSAGIQTTAAASPTITLSASTLSGVLAATYPAASTARSFTVSGAALTGNLTVQPSPANSNLEFSTSENGTYSSSLTLTASGGTVAPTTVWVRLKTKAAAGTYNNAVIRVSGGDATQQDIAATSSGNTVTAKALTISGATATARAFNGTTTVAVSGGSLVGVESGDSVTLGGSPTGTVSTATAADNKAVTVTGYTIDNTNYSLSQPTGVTVNISKATPVIATAPTASAVIKGARLDFSTLTGGSVTGVGGATLTGGTFAWTDAGSTIVTATGSRSVTYTPQDTTNYANATANITLTGNPVPAPNSVSASATGQTSIDLTTSRNSGINVLIVRKQGSAVDFTPNDTTSYTNGQDLGGGNIVVRGSTASDTVSDTGLTHSTQYHYKVFSEYYGYYSSGLTANATTDSPPPNYGFRDDGGVNLPTLTYSVNGTSSSDKGSAFNSKNLSSSVTSLSLTGADVKTWKSSGGDVTGAKIGYKIWKQGESEPASYTERELGFTRNDNEPTNTLQTWANFGSSINLLTALGTNYGTYNFKVLFYVNGTGTPSGSWAASNGPYTATFTYPQPPTISTTGSLSALSTTYGTASSSTSFNVSGVNMGAGISINPPAGFEVSTTSNFSSNVGSNGSPITVGAAGTISSTTIYVRLSSSTSAGSKSGNIVLTSSGASNVNVATAASTVNKKSLGITVDDQTVAYGYPASNNTVVPSASVTAQGSYEVTTADLVPGDTESVVTGSAVYSTTYLQGDLPGTANRTVTITSGLSAANYELSITPGAVTVSSLPEATLGATSSTVNSATLNFTRAGYAVTVVRRASGTASWTPTPGSNPTTSFTNGQVIDDNTIVDRQNFGTSVSDSGLAAGSQYVYKVFSENWGYYSAGVEATITTAARTITIGGTPLAAVNTTYGTASATPTTFTVTGANLTGNLTVTAPPGFEVSTASGSGYNGSITLAATSGTVAQTTVYVRLAAATVPGNYSGNVAVSGGDATTQNVATVQSTVAKKTLSVTGITGANKVYDGTTTASVTGSAALSGTLVGSDAVTLGGSPSFNFADANVGTGKTITATGYALEGAQASRYEITQPSGLTADITQKGLTITGASATNRAYDGSLTVAITGGTLLGVETGDVANVTLGGSPTGSVVSADVGDGKAVTVTGFSISGSAASNYSLAQPTGLTVNITGAQSLPEGALLDVVDGAYVITDSGGTPLTGATYTYSHAGRSVGGLTRTYAFLSYSSATEPTAPGFYSVTVTAGGAYTGSLSEDYAIAGPLALPEGDAIEPTKIAGVTRVRLNASTLLGSLQRVTSEGTLSTGAAGLTWTGTTAGLSQMPVGYDPATMPNTVTHSTSFVTLTPPGAGASVSDSFTVMVSDGVTPVAFPVTVTSTAAPTFDLQIRKLVPIDGDPSNMKAIFLTRPNRTVELEFFTASGFVPVRDKDTVVSANTQNSLTMMVDGNAVERPPDKIPTGSSGVLELTVPASQSSMSFRAKPVIAPQP
jgi:hypothetical protein